MLKVSELKIGDQIIAISKKSPKIGIYYGKVESKPTFGIVILENSEGGILMDKHRIFYIDTPINRILLGIKE